MTVQSGQIHLSEEKIILVIPATVAGGHVNLVNHGESPAYLGGADVTSLTGNRLVKDADIEFTVGPNEAVYGTCASGEKCDVSYLMTQATCCPT